MITDLQFSVGQSNAPALAQFPTPGNLMTLVVTERSGATTSTITGSNWVKVLESVISATNNNNRKYMAVYMKFAEVGEPRMVSIGGLIATPGYAWVEWQSDSGEMASLAYAAQAVQGYDTAAISYVTGTTPSVSSTNKFLIGICYTKVGGTTEVPFSTWSAPLSEDGQLNQGTNGMDISVASGVSSSSGTHTATASGPVAASRGAIAALLVFTISGGTPPPPPSDSSKFFQFL